MRHGHNQCSINNKTKYLYRHYLCLRCENMIKLSRSVDTNGYAASTASQVSGNTAIIPALVPAIFLTGTI